MLCIVTTVQDTGTPGCCGLSDGLCVGLVKRQSPVPKPNSSITFGEARLRDEIVWLQTQLNEARGYKCKPENTTGEDDNEPKQPPVLSKINLKYVLYNDPPKCNN
ncbi:hypothetical protein WMY93_022910 [Mugilogobius chulae]|uniref:Uncharacterized protein n=1 Tax=Mugilogobius chulae TaxID=88201 RepID=A0AAW0N8A8_9GOBI